MAQIDSLDANVVLRLLIGDVPAQRKKVYELLNTPRSLHFISDVCLNEVIYVLENLYLYERKEIKRVLYSFFEQHDDTINYNRALIHETLEFWVEHLALSFNDCYMAFYAEHNNVEPLFTFDKKLATQHLSAKLV